MISRGQSHAQKRASASTITPLKTENTVTAMPKTIPEATPEAAKTVFTKEEMLEDYDQLWDDLYAYYPYLPVLEESFDIHLEAFRQDNRQTLITRIKDVDGFAVLLTDTLYQMNNLGHLQFVTPDTYYTFYNLANDDIYEKYPDLFNLSQLYRDTFLNEQTEAAYQYLSNADGSPAEQDTTLSDLPGVITRYFPEYSTAYFYFATFDSPWLVPRDRNVITDYLASLEDRPVTNIIIDITGNRGGSGDYWTNNIVTPLLDGDYEADFYTYFKNSPIADETLTNLFERGFRPERIQDIPDSVHVPAFVQEYGFDSYVNEKISFPLDSDSQHSETAATTAKRWVLINNGSFSAADALAHFCKDSGWATLVGTNTAGDGIGTASIFTRLENTGLLIRMNIGIGANADGTMNAVVGTAPDIYSLKGETPLDTCLRMIGEEQGAGK